MIGLRGKALLCYQCLSCTLGCPVVDEMEELPHELVNYARLGLLDRLISSNSIWVCVSCFSCSERCPNGIDISSLLEWARGEAMKKGLVPREEAAFHKAFFEELRKRGRVSELLFVLKFKRLSGAILKPSLKEVFYAFKMLFSGRLKVVPDRVRGIGEFRRLFGDG